MPKTSAQKSHLAVGLISGTSMDGIDAAVVRISGPLEQPHVDLLAFETLPYSSGVRDRLMRVAAGDSTTAGEISQINFLLGELFAAAAQKVCKKAKISTRRLSGIGSHGQTIFHQGAASSFCGGKVASTLQIAEPALIAERCGIPVVADFRPADIAAGGQGAPLVPLMDYLLLRDARKGTIALNIGGIANMTVIPAGAKQDQVMGFDTGPGNMVIDGLVRRFTNGKKGYDAGGRRAASGRVIEPLLEDMLRHSFFKLKPPKSAGREQFGEEFAQRFVGNRRGARPADLLRTATELTARTIARALEQFVLKKTPIQRVIVSGGGAHNGFLMARLAELLPSLRVHRSDEFGIHVDAKEAMAFALLADRTLHRLPGNLPSVTGARRAVVLGKVSRPQIQS